MSRVSNRRALVYLGFPVLAITMSTLIAVLLLLQPAAYAQSTATVTATVVDQSGGVIVGAKATLKNEATQDIRETVSNTSGLFTFAAVSPGRYSLKVEYAGFKSWETSGIAVRPDDKIGLGEVKLLVGTPTETVTVEASDRPIPTETADRSAIITSKDISNLAVEGRSASELLRVLPGVAITGGTSGRTNQASWDPTVAGVGSSVGAYTVQGSQPQVGGVDIVDDGAHVIDPGCNCSATENVNMDMIQELKIQTSAFGAENAHGPVVVNAVGKSGSTEFHGESFFYARNSALNANDHLNTQQQLAKPSDKYYYPGGNIGGPVRIPHTDFNHSNKLFFWSGFEYYDQTIPGTIFSTVVPTKKMRGGDFSQATLAASGLCPSGAGTNAPLLFCNVPTYTANGTPIVNGQITSDLTDPGGTALMNFIPMPNVDPTTHGGNNFVEELVSARNSFQLRNKVDYNITERTRLSVTYDYQRAYSDWPVNQWWVPGGSVPYPTDAVAHMPAHTISGDFRHDFSPTLTNEFIAAYSFFNSPYTLVDPSAVARSTLAYPYKGLYKNGIQQMPAMIDWVNGGYPQIYMEGGFENGSIYSKKLLPTFSDNVIKTIQKHTLKFGIYWERTTNNQVAVATTNGQLTFYPWAYEYSGKLGPINGWAGCSGSTPVCFNPVADILMGIPDSYAETSSDQPTNMSYTTFSWYAADSWKLTKRLTLDFGLRLDHLGPWHDNTGLGFAIWNASAAAMQWHATNSSIPNSGVTVPALFTSPRFGLAYDVFGTGKTVLRGGWGAYRFHDGYNDYVGPLTMGQNVKSVTITPSNVYPLSLANVDAFNANSAATAGNVNGLDPKDHQEPLVYNYSFTISQKMPWKSVFEVAYVGNQSKDLLLENAGGTNNMQNINLIPIGGMYKPDPNPNSPNFGQTPTINTIGNFNAQDYRPFPNYQAVNVVRHSSYANYNALQVTWNRQTGRISYGLNYTFSKALGLYGDWRAGIAPDPTNFAHDYGPLAIDHTHIVNANYQFDFGSPVHGANTLARGVANGWLFSGITSFSSGSPINSFNANPNFGLGGTIVNPASPSSTIALDSTHMLGTPDVFLEPVVLCNPTANLKAYQYFNGTCFGPPSPPTGSTFTNGTYGIPYIHAPAFTNTDLSVFKTFSITERHKLQFRFSAFNFLNYGNPTFYDSITTGANALKLNYLANTSTGKNQLTNANFGFADYSVGRRVMEMALKYTF